MECKKRKGIVFARYLWLYGEIVSKGPVSFETISEDWSYALLNDDNTPLPHKTFENHRRAIEDMFCISIECNRRDNTYYIDPDIDLDFSRATMEMLNGALLFNRVHSNPQMRRFIRPEQCGDESSMLFTVTDALAEGRELNLRYRHNYDPTREENYRVKPIAVKQFRCRWYLIAELEDSSTYSFPLDRIVYLEKGDKTTPSTYDADELFEHSYGIIREDSVPIENIKLKVDREQANYFISRPLHTSQRIVELSEQYVIFDLNLSPTYDFTMELLSHGAKVEVLAPQSLRNQLATKIKEMSNLYTE